jgi:hypothetical protein
LIWVRGFEEARNHFLSEIKKLEVKIVSLEEDSQMFLSEHDENVRLHFENVDLKEQNARLREALEWISSGKTFCSYSVSKMDKKCANVARTALEKK